MSLETVREAGPKAASALAAFLEAMPEAAAVQARSLAHAWLGGGAELAVGQHAVRLTAGQDPERFTAATLHGPRGDAPARLELCRVILEKHGVDGDAFMHWSDEFADLAHHGFDPAQKYPEVPLGPGLTDAELARLVTGLRDLAQMVRPRG